MFPLLYDEVREDGVVVRGESPFAGLHISDKHRRLRIEQELREARIRMRRMVTDGDGAASALANVVDRKIRQVRSPLRALLRLDGKDPGAGLEEVIRAAGERFGAPAEAALKPAADGAAAHDALVRLLDAAIEDVDKRDDREGGDAVIEWFDVFPFNLPPGMSFLGVYTLLAIATFVALGAARGAIARAFAGRPPPPPGPRGPLGQSYRSPDAPERPVGLARGLAPVGRAGVVGRLAPWGQQRRRVRHRRRPLRRGVARAQPQRQR